MLRTNTKKARQNVRAYIMDNFDPSNYTDTAPQEWPEIARFIWDTFQSEKQHQRGNLQELFEEWASGLPSVLDCCYYYNRSAVDDLGAILEETEAEKARFTEQQAEQRLTYLIFSELLKATR